MRAATVRRQVRKRDNCVAEEVILGAALHCGLVALLILWQARPSAPPTISVDECIIFLRVCCEPVRGNLIEDTNVQLVRQIRDVEHQVLIPSRRRDCHSADTPTPSVLNHLLKGSRGVQQNDSLADGYSFHSGEVLLSMVLVATTCLFWSPAIVATQSAAPAVGTFRSSAY